MKNVAQWKFTPRRVSDNNLRLTVSSNKHIFMHFTLLRLQQTHFHAFYTLTSPTNTFSCILHSYVSNKHIFMHFTLLRLQQTHFHAFYTLTSPTNTFSCILHSYVSNKHIFMHFTLLRLQQTHFHAFYALTSLSLCRFVLK